MYQTKQSFWQRAKNRAKEELRKGTPKVKAAAKKAGQKAIGGGKRAAKEQYKAYQEETKHHERSINELRELRRLSRHMKKQKIKD